MALLTAAQLSALTLSLCTSTFSVLRRTGRASPGSLSRGQDVELAVLAAGIDATPEVDAQERWRNGGWRSIGRIGGGRGM